MIRVRLQLSAAVEVSVTLSQLLVEGVGVGMWRDGRRRVSPSRGGGRVCAYDSVEAKGAVILGLCGYPSR